MKTPLLHPVIATGVVINVAVLAVFLAWAGDDTARATQLLREDGIVEWMQFLCFTLTALLLAFVAADRFGRGSGITLEVLGLAGLSLLVAVAALEEISWFQRVLAVKTPEFFQQHNRQGETNLHNLAVGGASLHKAVLVKLIFLAGITHNLVLPLLARWKPAVRRWVERLGLYLPPLSAGIVYLVLVLLSQVLSGHPRRGELSEMFGAVHYLATVFAAYLVGLAYEGRPVFENQADRKRLSALFALFMVFVLLAGLLLGTTSAVVAGE